MKPINLKRLAISAFFAFLGSAPFAAQNGMIVSDQGSEPDQIISADWYMSDDTAQDLVGTTNATLKLQFGDPDTWDILVSDDDDGQTTWTAINGPGLTAFLDKRYVTRSQAPADPPAGDDVFNKTLKLRPYSTNTGIQIAGTGGIGMTISTFGVGMTIANTNAASGAASALIQNVGNGPGVVIATVADSVSTVSTGGKGGYFTGLTHGAHGFSSASVGVFGESTSGQGGFFSSNSGNSLLARSGAAANTEATIGAVQVASQAGTVKGLEVFTSAFAETFSADFNGHGGFDSKTDAIIFTLQGHSTQTNPAIVIETSAGTDAITGYAVGQLVIDANADQKDLIVEGHSTQTNPIVEVRDSSQVPQFRAGGDTSNYHGAFYSQNSSTATRGILNQQSTGSAHAPLLVFKKTRGTVASPAACQQNDYEGVFLWKGNDSGNTERTNGVFGHRITGAVGANSMPGEVFVACSTASNDDPYSTGDLVARFLSTNKIMFLGNTITAAPDFDIALGNAAAKTMGIQRQTAAATAGVGFTISGDGATAGSTDKNGGNLTLTGGTPTGTGVSTIVLNAAGGGSTGTSDTAPTTTATVKYDRVDFSVLRWRDFAILGSVGYSNWSLGTDGLNSAVDGQVCHVPIHYEAGTTLTRLRIKYAGSDASTGVLVTLRKRDESSTTTTYTTVGAQQSMLNNGAVVTTYDFSDEAMTASTSYEIIIESQVPGGQNVTFYAWGVETNPRTM